MIKIIGFLVAIVLSFNTFAMSMSHAKDIYIRIAKANGLRVVPELVVINDNSVNAEAQGSRIGIYVGMLKNVRNDSEMALVLGHELAHGRLGHSGSTPSNEFAADKLGAKYAHSAGYNVCVGAQLLKRFGSVASKTHPAGTERFKRLGCS